MIVLGSALINFPIMGLQTGSELARTHTPVINPANLQIIAYELEGHNLTEHPSLLRLADVRELTNRSMIVDSNDEFVTPDDIIKLNDIYMLHFNPLDMHVIDEKKRKLGKVIDFTLDTSSFYIQQLVVRRPLLKSLNDTELMIHRSQIIEINDKAIVVHSETQAPEPERSEVIGSYINPFRKSEPTADSAEPIERG